MAKLQNACRGDIRNIDPDILPFDFCCRADIVGDPFHNGFLLFVGATAPDIGSYPDEPFGCRFAADEMTCPPNFVEQNLHECRGTPFFGMNDIMNSAIAARCAGVSRPVAVEHT
jgi:hypothetical protein